jgi:hypothetical protein
MSDDLDDLIEQLEREEAQPWPRRAARETWRFFRYRLKRVPRNTRLTLFCARQRLTRGWDVRSVWGLDYWLGRTLGAQLVYMADIAHGWPGDYEGGFDKWVADLRLHGEALLHYARSSDDIKYTLTLSHDDEKAIHEQAQAAMHWVADNFGALWD